MHVSDSQILNTTIQHSGYYTLGVSLLLCILDKGLQSYYLFTENGFASYQ